jgi:GTP-binding protein
VSAVTGEGMDSMMKAVGELVRAARLQVHVSTEPYQQVYVYNPPEDEDLEIEKTGRGEFMVHGKHVERMVVMTEIGNDEAVAHLQRRLRRAGVEQALVRSGALDGDSITIGPVTFTFDGEGTEE